LNSRIWPNRTKIKLKEFIRRLYLEDAGLRFRLRRWTMIVKRRTRHGRNDSFRCHAGTEGFDRIEERSADRRLTAGIVKDILTKSPTHPHGIKVRLESGEVGG